MIRKVSLQKMMGCAPPRVCVSWKARAAFGTSGRATCSLIRPSEYFALCYLVMEWIDYNVWGLLTTLVDIPLPVMCVRRERRVSHPRTRQT